MKIHSTAVVSPRATVHSSVEIGPFAVVEAEAVIGQGCHLAARSSVKSHTVLGRDVVVGEGAVLGGMPQHISPPEDAGRVVIGERTVIRENVTVHRAMSCQGETRIGADCLLMVGAHVAHDCTVGNRVILTNNVLLGGHVQVGDRAVLGGAVAVHQHCRIGRLAMIGGCARIVQDVPPFVLADGEGGMIVGLNRIGIRRCGMDPADAAQLKAAYRLIYRQGLPFDEMIAALEQAFPSGPALEFAAFFKSGKRGFVQERRCPPKAAIRLHPAPEDLGDEAPALKRLAG
ncbi:MAG: acyl-ACP--UDP-N-acetylglucosamine O-acyltransferase [Pirellulales bacterium]|nr:acyl-ACP--UDP-N-acetylglucosamine O-acyltransferase [Pirellulales bacterium]